MPGFLERMTLKKSRTIRGLGTADVGDAGVSLRLIPYRAAVDEIFETDL